MTATAEPATMDTQWQECCERLAAEANGDDAVRLFVPRTAKPRIVMSRERFESMCQDADPEHALERLQAMVWQVTHQHEVCALPNIVKEKLLEVVKTLTELGKLSVERDSFGWNLVEVK